MDDRPEGRDPMSDTVSPPRRLPVRLAAFVGLSGYLGWAAVVSRLPGHRLLDTVLLLAVAALVGWWGTRPAALLVGALGWPFYSGFVTHSGGQLGFAGGDRDVLVASALLITAIAASALRSRVLTTRLRQFYRAGLPLPRPPVTDR